MQDLPARRGAAGALSATHRAEAAAELIARSASAHTRRVYASALGQLAAWLDGRRLDDASLAAYLGYLHQAGRAPATAALAVAAVRRATRAAGEEPPDGPLTRQALEDFRRSAAADAPARRGQARGASPPRSAPPCSPPVTGRAAPAVASSASRRAERRGLVDAVIVALFFHGALRRSEVAVLRWADVELADGGDVVVTVGRLKTNQAGDHPDVRRLVGSCAAAVRRLQAATAPESGDSVVGLGVDQVNRRFAAACAAAGLDGRRTSPGGRVGLAVELTARGAATHAVQLAGGWKDASMVVRYAASVATRDAVSRYMR